MCPITLGVTGPIANYLSKGIAAFFVGLFAFSPILAGLVIDRGQRKHRPPGGRKRQPSHRCGHRGHYRHGGDGTGKEMVNEKGAQRDGIIDRPRGPSPPCTCPCEMRWKRAESQGILKSTRTGPVFPPPSPAPGFPESPAPGRGFPGGSISSLVSSTVSTSWPPAVRLEQPTTPATPLMSPDTIRSIRGCQLPPRNFFKDTSLTPVTVSRLPWSAKRFKGTHWRRAL